MSQWEQLKARRAARLARQQIVGYIKAPLMLGDLTADEAREVLSRVISGKLAWKSPRGKRFYDVPRRGRVAWLIPA